MHTLLALGPLAGPLVLADPGSLADPVVLAKGGGGAVVVLHGIALTPFWVGPLVAGLVYGGIYRYYRNRDKRHDLERSTRTEVYRLDRFDTRVSSVRGSRSSVIAHRNDHLPLARVRRWKL